MRESFTVHKPIAPHHLFSGVKLNQNCSQAFLKIVLYNTQDFHVQAFKEFRVEFTLLLGVAQA